MEYTMLICKHGVVHQKIHVFTSYTRVSDIVSLCLERIAKANLTDWHEAIIMGGDKQISTITNKTV